MGRGAHIYAARNRRVQLGTLRPGTSVKLRSPEPISGGEGCKSNRWYQVEPLGYVCVDKSVTRELDGELFRALASIAPRRDETLPYDYAYVTGAPMYGKLPSIKEARSAESKYLPIEKLKRPVKPGGHEELAIGEAPAPAPTPFFLEGGRSAPLMPFAHEGLVRKSVPEGNMIAFQGTVASDDGRLFLKAWNLTLVPADRTRVFKQSEFHGVALGEGDVKAPLAWTRRQPRAMFRKDEGGAMVEAGASIPPRSYVLLRGNTIEHGGATYYETREGGLFVRASDVSVVDELFEIPKGVGEDERWIDVSLSEGTLTLLEGARPVYSTLSSPGAGGTTESASLSIPKLLAGAFSPLGLYRVAYKYRSAVMTPEDGPEPEKRWIDDVPYAMYFRAPYAIHGVYWHEDFGMPKSGGCINLSPRDARHVFDWTEPKVPDDWYGASSSLPNQKGTWINIHR